MKRPSFPNWVTENRIIGVAAAGAVVFALAKMDCDGTPEQAANHMDPQELVEEDPLDRERRETTGAIEETFKDTGNPEEGVALSDIIDAANAQKTPVLLENTITYTEREQKFNKKAHEKFAQTITELAEDKKIEIESYEIRGQVIDFVLKDGHKMSLTFFLYKDESGELHTRTRADGQEEQLFFFTEMRFDGKPIKLTDNNLNPLTPALHTGADIMRIFLMGVQDKHQKAQ